MKTHRLLSALKITLIAAVVSTLVGCAHATKRSVSAYELTERAAALPPGWQVVAPNSALNLPTNQVVGFSTNAVFITTNKLGFWSPRPKIYVAIHAKWEDRSSGGGTFMFTDPSASQIASGIQNQTALGGSHTFDLGEFKSVITTNAVQAIKESASGVGNVAGTLLNKATTGN